MSEKYELDEYLQHAIDEMFPKMKASALSIVIYHADPDPKLCLELGAAILFDKPLIVMAAPDRPIPPVLLRIASAVIVGTMTEPGMQERIKQAISKVLATDPRVQ